MRLAITFMVVLALLVALYGVTYLLGTPFKLSVVLPTRKLNFLALKGPLAQSLLWRTAFAIHLIGGSIGLVLGAVQFFYRFNNAYTHRVVGSCYALALLSSSTAGLYLSYFASVSRLGIIGFFVTDIGWLVSTWLGVQAVRRKNWQRHKIWFLRSYAFTLVVVSFRILFQVFFNGLRLDFDLAYTLGIWLSLGLNILVAEIIIRRKFAAGLLPVTGNNHYGAAGAKPALPTRDTEVLLA